MFYQRNQRDAEAFDQYLFDLKRLARYCEFGDSEPTMLRDRIVMGVFDKKLQAKFLEMANLTYDNAVEKARTNEASRVQSATMNSASQANNEVHAVRAETSNQSHGSNKEADKTTTIPVQTQDRRVPLAVVVKIHKETLSIAHIVD